MPAAEIRPADHVDTVTLVDSVLQAQVSSVLQAESKPAAKCRSKWWEPTNVITRRDHEVIRVVLSALFARGARTPREDGRC
jgi:hypothetical protein